MRVTTGRIKSLPTEASEPLIQRMHRKTNTRLQRRSYTKMREVAAMHPGISWPRPPLDRVIPAKLKDVCLVPLLMKAISAPISLLVNELLHNREQLAKRLLKGEVNPVRPTRLRAISSPGAACPCTRALKSDAATVTGAREKMRPVAVR